MIAATSMTLHLSWSRCCLQKKTLMDCSSNGLERRSCGARRRDWTSTTSSTCKQAATMPITNTSSFSSIYQEKLRYWKHMVCQEKSTSVHAISRHSTTPTPPQHTQDASFGLRFDVPCFSYRTASCCCNVVCYSRSLSSPCGGYSSKYSGPLFVLLTVPPMPFTM